MWELRHGGERWRMADFCVLKRWVVEVAMHDLMRSRGMWMWMWMWSLVLRILTRLLQQLLMQRRRQRRQQQQQQQQQQQLLLSRLVPLVCRGPSSPLYAGEI